MARVASVGVIANPFELSPRAAGGGFGGAPDLRERISLPRWSTRPFTFAAASQLLPARAGNPALETIGSRSVARAASSAARVEVYAYDAKLGRDVLVEQTGGSRSGNEIARRAFENGTRVHEYFRQTYGRDGWDNKGATTKLRVHAPDYDGSSAMNNARWYHDEGRIWLGDGDGSLFAPLGNAADIVAHEWIHGVVDAEVRLRYAGQEGALHESFADVLATGIDRNWSIGEAAYTPGVPGDSLRDLRRPTYGSYEKLPAWVDEVHDLSGIPSLAAYKVAAAIGHDAMLHIWYDALTNHLRNDAGFSGAYQATVAAAEVRHGKGSAQAQAVRDAWNAVGIDASTPTERGSSFAAAAFSLDGLSLVADARSAAVQAANGALLAG